MRKLEDGEKGGENTSLVTLGHLHAACNAELPAKPQIANRVSKMAKKVMTGVIMGKNKFALKCSSGKIKCFKTMLVFFVFNGKPGHRGPTQPA